MQRSNTDTKAQAPQPTTARPSRQVYAEYRGDLLISVRRDDRPGQEPGFIGFAFELDGYGGSRLLRKTSRYPRVTTAREMILALLSPRCDGGAL